ncbi:Peptidyl-prolyl cis-trans isomerase [Zea mays]|uniref:peptidylprolyl isomerase n=3 Tax=Zea mays TaxID=4577 RepID=A0A1D6M5T1_MAIZE|nr:Peptidyl-prolyl cis-trans isomerase [Zea mays]
MEVARIAGGIAAMTPWMEDFSRMAGVRRARWRLMEATAPWVEAAAAAAGRLRGGCLRVAERSTKVMEEMIDLTGDGGVLKTVVRKAKDDAIAPSESLPLVDVHYEGTLAETGEVFDTTHEDNSIFSFEIGQGAVIKAWDIALRTMKVGEVAKITCKSEYAYGAAGSPPEIPPNATLIFEVELVACRPRKGSSLGSVSDEKARLEELKKQRELAAATKEEEKKKREEAKAAAAARVQAKLDAKKGKGKGKGK